MNRWANGIWVLGLMGCTELRELAETSVNSPLTKAEQEAAYADACQALSDARKNVPMPNQADSNRYFFESAYCKAPPTPDTSLGNLDYCEKLERQVPDFCRENGVPLLECVTEVDTNVVAEDCADVWLGETCDPTPPMTTPQPSVDGLWLSCPGGGISKGGSRYGINEFRIALPALQTEHCTDGHRYEVTCLVGSNCTMDCECTVDANITRTVTVTRIDYDLPNDTVLAACGWTP